MTPAERYIRDAKAAGCPRDQVENFTWAGIVLQPQQFKASAAARLCDRRCPSCEADILANWRQSSGCPNCGPTKV